VTFTALWHYVNCRIIIVIINAGVVEVQTCKKWQWHQMSTSVRTQIKRETKKHTTLREWRMSTVG